MTYIDLPSNSSMDYYPNNTLQNYKTRVLLSDDFSGEWEVGLASIIYPGIYNNVNEEDSTVHVQFKDRRVVTRSIAVGRYSSIDQLVGALNEALNNAIPPTCYDKFQLTYDELKGKVNYQVIENDERKVVGTVANVLGPNVITENTIRTEKNYNRIAGSTFSVRVSAMLGFQDPLDRNKYDPKHFGQNTGVNFNGQYVADLNKYQQPLYVYCDLMEPRVVGDSRTPLLRIIPHVEDYSKSACQSYKTFSRIHYHEMKHRHIHEVEIDIRDSFGNPIPFDIGTLTVTLHLRRRKSHF